MKQIRRGYLVLASVLILTILLTACGSGVETQATAANAENHATEGNTSPETAAERVVKHQFGETKVPADPKKIVVNFPRFAEDLLALGITPYAVAPAWNGFTPYLDEMLTSKGIKKLEGAGLAMNLEEVVGVEPDLIVGSFDDKGYEQMSKIAPTLSFEFEDWTKVLPKLGAFFGKEAEAQKIMDEYHLKAAQAKEKLTQALGNKTVMYFRISEKQYFFLGFGGEESTNLSRIFYRDLGLNLPEKLKSGEDWINEMSVEILPEINPDYIFLELYEGEAAGADKKLEELKQSAIWKGLNAVKNDHVFVVDGNLWVQSDGPIGNAKVLDDIVAQLVK
ncbi:ABC transporter substrate-binding protein [Cohnella sp.]|uniref:ABC transporter substrate-binding protein n=1 Tax=Cohnella sp. TaxID=1883426 RepID=UPI0035632DD7